MRKKQIVIVSIISFMIFLLPLTNVNAYSWYMADGTCDVRYYDTEGVFQGEGCYHNEIDIKSMKLEGSNVILELKDDFPTNASCYLYSIDITWEFLPYMSNTGSSGDYGWFGEEFPAEENQVVTSIYDEEGPVDYNESVGAITHSGRFITFPIPLFEDLPFKTPEFARCQTLYQPDLGLTGEKYRDDQNGTFTHTPSAPGFTYWVFTVGSVTVLALFSYKKKRND